MTNTVWFRFRGTGGPVVLDTSDSEAEFDTMLIVYVANGNAAGAEVDCDDDSGTGLHARLTRSYNAGVEYVVEVGGCQDCVDVNGDPTQPSGALALTLLANDARANPEMLPAGARSRARTRRPRRLLEPSHCPAAVPPTTRPSGSASPSITPGPQ